MKFSELQDGDQFQLSAKPGVTFEKAVNKYDEPICGRIGKRLFTFEKDTPVTLIKARPKPVVVTEEVPVAV